MRSTEQSLHDYLLKRWSDCDAISIESFKDLPGGYSKQTYSFEAHVTRNSAKQVYPLILRKNSPAATAILHNSRELEHTLLNRLRRHTSVPVPESYFAEMNPEIFGEPAMIIERVLGCTEATSLFKGPETAAEAESIARGLCEAIAALHTTDTRLLNSDEIFSDPKKIGVVPESWDRYMDGMLDYLIKDYSNIDFDTIPVFFDAYLHMRRNKPRPLPLVLVYGDLSPTNLVFQDGKLLALVDWELAHIGDPREDLAWFLFFEGAHGTRFFQSVNYPGGFLGYYNHLTGYNITQDELNYFLMFSFVTVGAQPIAAIKRRVLGQHKEILHMYLLQLVLGGVMLCSQLLGHQSKVE